MRRWEPSRERIGALDRIIEILVDQVVVDTGIVHTVMSIYIWAALLWRPALSFLHAIFYVVQRTPGWALLPIAVRRELCMMRGSLVFLSARLDREASPLVLAQDAAVSPSKPVNSELECYGAYCLAAAVPPLHETKAVIANIATTGRASVVPASLGGAPLRLQLLSDAYLLARTMLPAHWFEGASVVWERLWARRWRRPIAIVEGELRALVRWAEALLKMVMLYGCEFLALSDNLGVVGLVARGRTSRRHLNRHMRRIAAIEAITSSRIRVPWIDTGHQPGDGGTRAGSDGRLELGPVRWRHRALFIELGPGTGEFTAMVNRYGTETLPSWDVRAGGDDDLSNKKNLRKLLRLLESGQIYVMLWDLSTIDVMQTYHAGDATGPGRLSLLEIIIMTIAVITHRRGEFVISAPPNHHIWFSHEFVDAIAHQHCTTAVINNVDAHHRRHRTRVVSSVPLFLGTEANRGNCATSSHGHRPRRFAVGLCDMVARQINRAVLGRGSLVGSSRRSRSLA